MSANDPLKLNDAINTCLINLNIIKNCTCYCFDHIINIANLDIDNILSDEKYFNLWCFIKDKTL